MELTGTLQSRESEAVEGGSGTVDTVWETDTASQRVFLRPKGSVNHLSQYPVRTNPHRSELVSQGRGTELRRELVFAPCASNQAQTLTLSSNHLFDHLVLNIMRYGAKPARLETVR
jgi:hypothetical protein